MVERNEDVAEELAERESLRPLMDSFRPHLGDPVDVVVSKVSLKAGVNIHVAARDLYKLSSKELVKLVDGDPPRSLLGYLFSLYSLWFWVVVVFSALTALTIFILPQWNLLSLLRAVVGLIFPMYLPGYALIEALYPKRGELGRLERFALSVGISIALVPLTGLVLNYTPWGIQMGDSFLSLMFLVLILGVVATYRKYKYWKLTLRALA